MKLRVASSVAYAVLACCFAATSSAHFVFIVPEDPRPSVVLSETLEPDEQVGDLELPNGEFQAWDGTGELVALTYERVGKGHWRLSTPPNGTRMLIGRVPFGVRGDQEPALLCYLAKAVIGDPFANVPMLDDKVPAEIIAVGEAGKVRFALVVSGERKPGIEIIVVLPNGESEKVMTDADGWSREFTERGRLGVWSRSFVQQAGEHDGVAYSSVRYYPSLVITIPGGAQAGATDDSTTDSTTPEQTAPQATALRVPDMAQRASSFGAVVTGDGETYYMLGGNKDITHDYFRGMMGNTLYRFRVGEDEEWKAVSKLATDEDGVQGIALAARGHLLYRIGGMHAHNPEGERDDLYSLNTVACYDTTTGEWTAMPSLPIARSSIDAFVVGRYLVVVGGWTMRGRDNANRWAKTTLVMDLDADAPQWREIPQPFSRRALGVTALDGKVYVVGGLSADGSVTRRVDVLDPATGEWTRAPGIPDSYRFNGFSPAACALKGELYVQMGGGGIVRFNREMLTWDQVGTVTPRLVGRMLPHEKSGSLVILGGSHDGMPTDLVEIVVPEKK